MKTVKSWIPLLLAAALAAGGCAERRSAMIVAPKPSAGDPPAVVSAHWVWDRAALAAATAQAAASPLVQRAMREAPDASLPLVADGVVHAEGTLRDGTPASFTILPHGSPDDRTRGTFVTLMRRGESVLVERSQLITGRSPFDNETGFEPVPVGPQIIWVKCDATYAPATDGAAALSPERVNWSKFLRCFSGLAQGFADAGAAAATEFAPMFPAAAAVGSAVGTAVAAITCVAASWE